MCQKLGTLLRYRISLFYLFFFFSTFNSKRQTINEVIAPYNWLCIRHDKQEEGTFENSKYTTRVGWTRKGIRP